MTRKFAVLLHTSDYRGDHSADVCRVYDAPENITIAELLDRLIGKNPHATVEHIEIRIAEPLP